jgi:Tol biopolymer transport system component
MIATSDLLQDEAIRIWDADSSQLVKTVSTKAHTSVVAFSPDGHHLAYGGEAQVSVLTIENQRK